jgi:hypothetical protein
LSTWAPCTDDTAECADRIVSHVVERAERRPTTPAEREDYLTLTQTVRTENGLNEAISALIEAVLLTPQFLYRPEIGVITPDAPEGLIALDGYEIASRLSYFLWRAPPDAELSEAAGRGELATEPGIERHARRMLEDPRARETISDMHAQWFQIARNRNLMLDAEYFPGASPELYADLEASVLRYLDAAFWDEGTVEALFAGRFAFVNDRLAPIFGVDPPGTNELVRVELDPTQRAGILTQPGWLTLHSHTRVHSPIFRGNFVLHHVLCTPTPPPPPNIDTSESLAPNAMETTRQRTTRSHTGRCASCHARIDGVGFLFEHYDAYGRFRLQELGQAVDASGLVREAGDADGQYANAIDFGEQIAHSEFVGRCVSQHYLRYALGREIAPEESCAVRALSDRLAASGGDLRELVIAITTSPSFRYRTSAP